MPPSAMHVERDADDHLIGARATARSRPAPPRRTCRRACRPRCPRAPSRSRDRPPPRRTRRTAAWPRSRGRSLPERSVSEPPSAANAYGTAMRITCARNASVRIVDDHRALPRRARDRDRDDEHDALQHLGQLLRDDSPTASPPDRQKAEQQRRDARRRPDASRPSSAAEMPSRPVPRRAPPRTRACGPSRSSSRRARRARPRRSSRAISHAADRDAGRARGLGIAADREPRLAPRRARAQPPHQRDRAEREHERDVRRAAAERRAAAAARPRAIGAPVRRAALEQARVPSTSTTPATIALSMIDVITSCAPRATRKTPISAADRATGERPPRARTPGSRSPPASRRAARCRRARTRTRPRRAAPRRRC